VPGMRSKKPDRRRVLRARPVRALSGSCWHLHIVSIRPYLSKGRGPSGATLGVL
jgi:hypothetical protein